MEGVTFSALFVLLTHGASAMPETPSMKTNVTGWNHIKSFPQEYSGLRGDPQHYDTYVGEQHNLQTVLVKKLSDWHRQHSTGIDLSFTSNERTFDQLGSLKFNVTLNHADSVIPSLKDMIQHYSELTGVETHLASMLDGKAHIQFMLYGEMHQDQSVASVIATKTIALPMDNQGAVALSFGANEFEYFWQQEWNEKPVLFDDVKDFRVEGLLITAETKNNKTLRSDFSEFFPINATEQYIELALTLESPLIQK